MNDTITLQTVLEELLALQLIGPKRIGPIKTAIKQYAAILGYGSAAECPRASFVKPDKVRNRLIDNNAPANLGLDGVRNLKNNVSFVLRKATEKGIVSSPTVELACTNAVRMVKDMPPRNEHVCPAKYIIDPIPARLEQEISEYLTWSTKTTERTRPKRLHKRPETFEYHRLTLLRTAGFLVNIQKQNPRSVNLFSITQSVKAIDYIEWRIEQQKRFTGGSRTALGHIIAAARYLEITSKSKRRKQTIQRSIAKLRAFEATLGVPVKVQDKKKRWLSLNALEAVARANYPSHVKRFNQLTLFSSAETIGDLAGLAGKSNYRLYASRVLQSLMLHLLIRLPLRQRNLREMAWHPVSAEDGRNLYRKNGSWRLRFRGTELKVSERRGRINSIDHSFPAELTTLLEEWLYHWRTILVSLQKPTDLGSERLTAGQELVFLNYSGRPLKQNSLTHRLSCATYRFTGVAVNPHMLRTIYPTEYIQETHNFAVPAYVLGNTVSTMFKSYTELLDEECGQLANEWISRKLNGKSQDENDDTARPSFPKRVHPRRK